MSEADKFVREFHIKFGVPILSEPHVPDSKRRKLRVDLIREELEELETSSELRDLVGVADALADIIYVAYGAAHEWGIPLDEVLKEVHRSNMTKVWPDGTVHRRADGKVLKPSTYSQPNLKDIVSSGDNDK